MVKKKRLTAKERRTSILIAATSVFARSNYQAARTAEIAAEAGVSEATIYKHFPSKKAIYLEILKHMSGRIIVFWRTEAEREPDAYNALRNMGLTYYRRMSKHPDELKVQFQAISEVGDPEIAARLHEDHKNYMGFIRKIIQRGIRQGVFRADADPAVMGWLFNGVGITMNVMRILSFKREFNEKAATKIIDHLLESIAIRS